MSADFESLCRLIQANEAHQYKRTAHNLDEMVGYKTWDEVLRLTAEYTGADFSVFGNN